MLSLEDWKDAERQNRADSQLGLLICISKVAANSPSLISNFPLRVGFPLRGSF